MPAINTRHLPFFDNYGQARAYYDKTKPIRGSDNKRPLGDRKRHNTTTITFDPSTEDVSCELYGTPLVVFHKNNNITINAYRSMSSNAFSRKVLPSGVSVTCGYDVNYICIWPCWKNGETKYLENGRYYYKFGKHITLVPNPTSGCDWLPDPATTQTWRVTRVDKSLANAALAKYNYMAFRAYLLTRLSFSETIPLGRHQVDRLECLLDREKWKLLINQQNLPNVNNCVNKRNYAESFLEKLRKDIYKKNNCFRTVESNYLTTLSDVVWSYRGPWDNR